MANPRVSRTSQRVVLRAPLRSVPGIISSAFPAVPRVASRTPVPGQDAPRSIAYPPALARALVLSLAAHRHPVAWTAAHQRSRLKFLIGWSTIGTLTLLAATAHCAHVVMLLWSWTAGR